VLIELASSFRKTALAAAVDRPLLHAALDRDRGRLELELAQEQIRGKHADREHWAPLRAKLERMRHDHRRSGSP